jgi:hypothetical protein
VSKSVLHIWVIALFMLLSSGAHAQQKKVWNLPNFDKKTIHFGFSLCLNTMSYITETDLTQTDSLISVETNPQSGFNLNVVSDLHLNKNFSLRFMPGLSFGQRNIEYVFEDQPRDVLVVKAVESTYLDMPLNFKYRSDRLNNFAAYVVAGGRYSLDLSSQFDTNNDVPVEQQLVRLKRHNFWYEFGFGMDFFLEYFKFSPEVKLSVGVNDVLIQDGTFWVSPIERVQPRMLTISFHFEG